MTTLFYGRIALAVLLDFLLQVTAFVALIVFDLLRAEDNRVDCFPCLKIPPSSVESDEGASMSFYFLLFFFSRTISNIGLDTPCLHGLTLALYPIHLVNWHLS